jgi:hypothetical protein
MAEELEETTEKSLTKPKKVDPVGRSFYGEKFERFNKIGEIVDLLPTFKEWYYEARVKEPNCTISSIVQSFNEQCAEPLGRTFFPYNSALRTWHRKWDLDLMQKKMDKDIIITPEKKIAQVIKTRNEGELILDGADDATLESGVRTLGGELLNDAFQMLRDDQELEDVIDSDILVKRRNYILNVFGHVTKLVHGKAALMLKASEEKRNNASFLMTLLAQATAGKMSDEQLDMLKGNYKKENEQPITVQL